MKIISSAARLVRQQTKTQVRSIPAKKVDQSLLSQSQAKAYFEAHKDEYRYIGFRGSNDRAANAINNGLEQYDIYLAPTTETALLYAPRKDGGIYNIYIRDRKSPDKVFAQKQDVGLYRYICSSHLKKPENPPYFILILKEDTPIEKLE